MARCHHLQGCKGRRGRREPGEAVWPGRQKTLRTKGSFDHRVATDTSLQTLSQVPPTPVSSHTASPPQSCRPGPARPRGLCTGGTPGPRERRPLTTQHSAVLPGTPSCRISWPQHLLSSPLVCPPVCSLCSSLLAPAPGPGRRPSISSLLTK